MVTVGNDGVFPLGTLDAQHASTAQLPLPLDGLTLPVWRPRSGRGLAYDKWESALFLLAAAMGIAPEQLSDGPPLLPDSLLVSLSPEDQEWTRAVHAVALRDWQRVNTKLYRVVLPSLLIDGPEFKHDDRAVREYVRLYLADGRGLVA